MTSTMRVDGEHVFLDCYDATVRGLYRYASRLTGGDQARTERLVRDVYVDLLRRSRERTMTELPAGWLHADLRRRAVEALRGAERDGAERRLVTTGDTQPAGDEPLSAVPDLTDRERIALTLRYVDGLGSADVAAALGASVRATEALMARARSRHRRDMSMTDGWTDRLLPERVPSSAFATQLRRDLSVGWGVRGSVRPADVPTRPSGRRHLALAMLIALAAVGLVAGAMALANRTQSTENVASAGPTLPAPPTSAAVTAPVTSVPSTSPFTLPGPTEPPSTGPQTSEPQVTEPSGSAPLLTVPPSSAPPAPTTTTEPVVVPTAQPERLAEVIDLASGALFGYHPPRGVAVDAVTAAVEPGLGVPTFDSGWYRFPDRDESDLACRTGLGWRVVQWGDVTMSFVQLDDGTEGLVRWAVGVDPDQQRQNGLTAAIPSGAPNPGVRVAGEAYFGTLDELADVGYTVEFLDEGGAPKETADPLGEARGRVLVGSAGTVGLHLYGGVIIGLDVSLANEC